MQFRIQSGNLICSDIWMLVPSNDGKKIKLQARISLLHIAFIWSQKCNCTELKLWIMCGGFLLWPINYAVASGLDKNFARLEVMCVWLRGKNNIYNDLKRRILHGATIVYRLCVPWEKPPSPQGKIPIWQLYRATKVRDARTIVG